jgi:hypothetical protein
MKVTLNAVVPSYRRRDVECIVRKHSNCADIAWQSSVSQQIVLCIESKAGDPAESPEGSIFASPRTGTRSIAAMTGYLEEQIWIAMSASGH